MQSDHTARIQVPPTERLPANQPVDAATVCLTPTATNSTQIALPVTNELFDQYAICSRIGNGGMGVVYLARDRRLGRYVAIKRLNAQALASPQLRQRFLHEARAVASLSHVHIIHIYALGEDEDGPFIVMEYVAGPDQTQVISVENGIPERNPNPPLTLDHYVTQRGRLTADEAIELMLKIGRAVAYAHANGVIHRDLKPSNILLDKSYEPKIVDFGLARLEHHDESKLTVTGEKLLSLGYGAPEQEQDASDTDARADVYGLGALLYFTLTGQNPRYFRDQDVPVPLREAVAKALATDRDQRWPTAQAFNDILHQIQTKTRVETPTVKTTWRCKWCDAVNPLSLKFCAECGWDGSEICPECGIDTFVGIQFCGNCGADARAYETLIQLIKKMREALKLQRYERVLSTASRIHGFEPAGPSGRRLLREVAQMRSQSERDITRREQLKEQIPMELRAENYERAANFIEQYREISEDKRGFDAERESLPELLFQRDLTRAQKALSARQWSLAKRVYGNLENEKTSERPEMLALRNALRRHQARLHFGTIFLSALVVGLFYLLSLPPVTSFTQGNLKPQTRLFYRPAFWCYQNGFLASALVDYAGLWLADTTTLTSPSPLLTYNTNDPKAHLPPPALPEELKEKQDEYSRLLQEAENALTVFEQVWPTEYLRELDTLMERRRMAGDFEGWSEVQGERKRFDDSRTLEESYVATLLELKTLMGKYHQMLTDQTLLHSRKLLSLCRRYVNELTDAQKLYTQQGQMEQATAVNNEIRRVRNLPNQLAAEELIASAATTGGSESGTSSRMLLTPTAEQHSQEIDLLRAELDDALLKIDQDTANQSDEWPNKYMAELSDLMDIFQQAGDYDSWQSISDESMRFAADRTITPREVVGMPAELSALQKRYIVLRNELYRQRAENIVTTITQHIKKLENTLKRFTVEGQMEAAAIVNAEIKRVQNHGVYLEALKELEPQGPPLPPSRRPSIEEVSDILMPDND